MHLQAEITLLMPFIFIIYLVLQVLSYFHHMKIKLFIIKLQFHEIHRVDLVYLLLYVKHIFHN